eukprot:1831166-Pyramimonas_sp.AAC.1
MTQVPVRGIATRTPCLSVHAVQSCAIGRKVQVGGVLSSRLQGRTSACGSQRSYFSASFGALSTTLGALQTRERTYRSSKIRRAAAKQPQIASAECPEQFVELAHKLADAAGEITSAYFRFVF